LRLYNSSIEKLIEEANNTFFFVLKKKNTKQSLSANYQNHSLKCATISSGSQEVGA
jgi:hypothetical protein